MDPSPYINYVSSTINLDFGFRILMHLMKLFTIGGNIKWNDTFLYNVICLPIEL